MTKASLKADLVVVLGLESLVLDNSILLFERMLCIHYSLCFRKDQCKIQALINSGSKINMMALAYIAKLSLKV